MARKKKITMGKTFETRKGKIGCYKYVNGKKVAFVEIKRPSSKLRKAVRKNKRRY